MVIKGKRGYVNNYGATPGAGSGNGKTVSVIDLEKNKVIGNAIEVGLAPAAITITPCCKYIYTANYVDGNPNTGTLTKINTCNNKVIGEIGPGFSGPFAITISPNGKRAYVTNFGSNNFEPFGTTVGIVNLESNKIERTIQLGIQPSGLDITPDGKYICVSNYNTLYAYVQKDPVEYLNLTPGQGTVNIIDIKKNAVVDTIEVGQSPSYVAISPNGKYVYVTNYTSNTMNIIRLYL